MPPGVLFAVYDAATGAPDYIPPEYIDVPELLAFLLKKRLLEFTPIDVSKMLGVTNKTIINRCVKLANNGFIVPNIVSQRNSFEDWVKECENLNSTEV